MAIHHSLDDTVSRLAADLAPVKRLAAPPLRAARWLALVLLMAAGLAAVGDMPGLARRLAIAPDMWLAVLASSATAVLGALAAFELSVPGRSARWALLPVPSLVVWVMASGMGCLRVWAAPSGAEAGSMGEARHCLVAILAMSVPLMALMMVMVRRACPLRPNLTALVAGLAIAAASATLLNFDHPFDASATDLLAHLVAVLMVIGANQAIARRTVARDQG